MEANRYRLNTHTRIVLALTTALVVSVLGGQTARAAGAGDVPVPVTPYSGFNATLTRAPYVTDLAQTTAYVNWATTSSTPGSVLVQPAPGGVCPSSISTWTSAAKRVPTSLPGPVNPTSAGSSSSMTGWAFSVINGAGTTIREFQASVELTGLSAGTQYCYAVFSTATAAAVDLLPAAQPYQMFSTLDPISTSSTTPLTFAVIADTGENYSYTTTSGSGIAFPNYVNPHQAALYKLIGSSGAKFLLNAGDIGYSGGTQSNYGDLQQTGTNPEVSNIFGPSYYPQTGGIPSFTADGNHGQNVTTLRNWPTPNTATASGGTYAFDSYSGVDGITGSYPDGWYAFSSGNVRIYMLDASWADGSVGTANGALCATPAYCTGYQADYDEHWQASSPEYQWLVRDLAANPGGVKLAVFHYPLRSDNATQPSDPYLLNSTANPAASSSLEKLLSDNGVGIAFNGHAHTYQRIIPRVPGQIINYVTGGGGGVLQPVLGGSVCSTLQKTASVYALGWTPSSTTAGAGTGSGCGVAAPQSAADVFSFLKVTVNGNQVTVTPTNAAGGTFDSQTYTYTPGGGVDTAPPSVPAGVAAATGAAAGEIDLSWAASSDTVGVAGYKVYRDGGSAAVATVSTGVSYADTGLTGGSTHSYAVSAFDAAGNESDKSSPVVSGVARSGSGAGTVTVAASDDATISKLSANTGTNYGNLSTLTVDSDQNVNDFLMKFTVPAGCTPSAASLTVTVGSATNSNSGHGGSFYAAPGSWSEGTVTAANAPLVTGSPVTLGAVAVSTAYTLNVSSLLPAGATGGSIVSLRATTTSTDAAVYVSRNATNGATAGPQLQLTCSGGGGGDTAAPSVPAGVAAATGAAAGEIDLSWAASSDTVGVAGYKVYRDGGSAAVATVSTGVSYADTGLTGGSTHSYAVSAFDAAGNESDKSSPVVSGVARSGSGAGTVTVAASDDATISKLSANTC